MSFWDMGAYAAMALAQTEMGRNSGSSSIAYGGAESAEKWFSDLDSRSRSPEPVRELPDLPHKGGGGSLPTPSVELSGADGLGSSDSKDQSSQDPTPPPAQNPAQTPRPTEPTGFPGPAPRDGRLPAPQSEKPQEIRLIRAERITKEGDVLKLRGNIHVQYRGYDLFGDELEANVVTNVFILRGRSQVIGRDAVVLGETIIVDFNAESFRAIDSAAEVRPAYFQGMTLANLYLRGKEIWGTEREIFGHDCDLTTCTYDRPHYFLDSRDINLRVGKRVILRHVKLNILGKVVLHLPYVSIPLDQRRDAYTPEVGRTPEEGYYIKTKWGVPVAGPNDLDVYADYFERLGLGVGARFRYLSAKSEGYIRAYGIFGDSDTVEIQTGHRQQFGRNQLQVENNYQQRNYLNAPQNTITTNRLTYTMAGRDRDTTRISYNRTHNDGSSFESTSQTFAISDLRTLWSRVRTQFDVSWVRSESAFTSGSSEREQVDVRFRGQQDLRRIQAELEYQRAIPVGTTSNFFSASDRTPVFTLKTDSKRLFGENVKIPFTAEISQGEFIDPSARDQVQRTNFDIRGNYRTLLGSRLELTSDARFKQSFYSDDTAQYALGYNTQAKYSLGRDTYFNLRYNYLEREGFTPLAIDRIGKTNQATADLSVRPARTLLLGLQTGYDYLIEERGELDSAWLPVGIRTEWRPKDWFMARVLPVYDPVRQVWSQVRFDLTYLPGATYVSLGARYDGFRQTWGQASLFLDNLKWGRTKFSSILTYNGYLKKFEERHYSVTYDLHCAEAVFQMRESNFGFRAGREYAFFIRLKAFPFDTPFGLTRRGAPIGTATGRTY